MQIDTRIAPEINVFHSINGHLIDDIDLEEFVRAETNNDL